MFQDSLLESGGRMKTRRGWTTAVSLGIQLLLVGLLVLVPLLHTDALPSTAYRELLTAPAPPLPATPAPQAEHQPQPRPNDSELRNGQVIQPERIPQTITMLVEEAPPPSVGEGGVVGSIAGSGLFGRSDGVLNSMIGAVGRAVMPTIRPPERLVVSTGVSQGMLIHRVEPVYPRAAIAARIQGEVLLQAVIGRDGTIQGLRVVRGHPLLAPAALQAVLQWRYRPYLLNGQPIEVETQVLVNFRLS